MRLLLITVVFICAWQDLLGAQEPASDFYRKGMEDIRAKRFEDAARNLDEAFDVAKDPKLKLRAAEALMQAQRECKDVDGYMSTAEYVIGHAERRAGRHLQSRALVAFLYQNGRLDEGIKRYEDSLKRDAEGITSLSVLVQIYEFSNRRDLARAEALKATLVKVEYRMGEERAKSLESLAKQEPALAASHLKDAAQFWLEIGENDKALAAVNASLAAAPENRSAILKYQYHESIGDMLVAMKLSSRAAEQYELAIKEAPAGILKENVEKKLKGVKSEG